MPKASFLLTLLLAAPALAQMITEIRVEGLLRVEREAVLGTMKSKVGDAFSATRLSLLDRAPCGT